MRCLRPILIGLALVASGLLANRAAVWLSEGSTRTNPKPLPTDRPQLELLTVPATALNLGEVHETKAFVVNLPITNTSNAQIVIKSLRTSCACMSADTEAVTIGPGNTHIARVVLDLTQSSPIRKQDGAFAAMVTPVIDDDSNSIQAGPWVITGLARQRLTFSQVVGDFGRIAQSCMPPAPIEVVISLSDRVESVIRNPSAA